MQVANISYMYHKATADNHNHNRVQWCTWNVPTVKSKVKLPLPLTNNYAVVWAEEVGTGNISLGVGVRNDHTEWRHPARTQPWQTANLSGLVLEDSATQAVLWKTWQESCGVARLAPLTLFSGELWRGKLGWLIKWLFTSCLWEAITRKRNMLWQWNFSHATVLR